MKPSQQLIFWRHIDRNFDYIEKSKNKFTQKNLDLFKSVQ